MKNLNEQIQKCDDQIAKYTSQKKELLKRQKIEKEKQKQQRLINIGTVVETVAGRPLNPETDLPLLKSYLERGFKDEISKQD